MARRYVLVRVLCEHKLTDQHFHETLDNSVRRYFGELGFARINPKVIEFHTDSSTGIVSCEREAFSELESAIALITKHSQIPMSVLVLRVSGTVKGLREAGLK